MQKISLMAVNSVCTAESGRSLGERVKEHFKGPSPIHLHSTTTKHPMDPEQFNIVKKLTAIPGPSKSPCSSVSRTLPSTETWQSTNFCTYGTIFYSHLLHYSTSLPAFHPPNPTHLNPPLQVSPLTGFPLPTAHIGGCTYFSW